MSQMPLQEVELYAFASSSAQFFLTPHEFDVDLDGTRYSSLSIERNELALGAEAAKSALELKLPPNGELVRHLLASALTGNTTSVTLRIGRKSEWGDDWWLSGTRWMGRVLGVGPGRGYGLIITVTGLFIVLAPLVAGLLRPIRRLEVELPDATAACVEPTPVQVEA